MKIIQILFSNYVINENKNLIFFSIGIIKTPWDLARAVIAVFLIDIYSSGSTTHSSFHSSSGTDSYQSLVWV